MKRTFFNVTQKSSKINPYSTYQLANGIKVATKVWNIFSNEGRKLISSQIAKTSFQEMQVNIESGEKLMADRAKRDPLASVEFFNKAAQIADAIIENYPIESLSSENKLLLAQAYASYADILRICSTGEIELRKEMVKKALELDPKNEIAKQLNFDMNFYDIVPEPSSNRL